MSVLAEEPDLKYTIRKEIIRVIDYDSGYISEIYYRGHTNKNQAIDIYYNSFDSIYDINLFLDKGKGKFKPHKKLEIGKKNRLSNSFYSDVNNKWFIIEKNSSFYYNYLKYSSELITLSKLPLIHKFQVDTFYYEIVLPKDFHLIYNIQNQNLCTYFSIDSSKRANEKIYKITATMDSISADTECKLERPLEILDEKPFVRLLVTPLEYKGFEGTFFNKWYKNKIDEVNKLDDNTKAIIDDLTADCGNNEDSIIYYIANFAQQKIKYIDILSGVGAFVPKDVNETLFDLQGDCKDYSNFICQALSYKGIEAYLGICATNSYFNDMDFPTISGGNHMICAIKRDEGWQFIDGTEQFGITKLPPLSVQGKHIYILDIKGGIVYQVEPLDMNINVCDHNIEIDISNDNYDGVFNYIFKGQKAFELKFAEWKYKESDLKKIVSYYIDSDSRGLTFDEFEVVGSANNYSVTGTLKLSKSVVNKIADKTLILLNFLPYPHALQKSIACENTNILTGCSINNNYKITLITDQDLQSLNYKNIHEEVNGFDFTFNATAEQNKLIIEYSFKYNDIYIRSEKIKSFNQINKKIDEVFKKSITLH